MVERGAIKHIVQRDKASRCGFCIVKLCDGIAGVAELRDERLSHDVWCILPKSNFCRSRRIKRFELFKDVVRDDDLGLS